VEDDDEHGGDGPDPVEGFRAFRPVGCLIMEEELHSTGTPVDAVCNLRDPVIAGDDELALLGTLVEGRVIDVFYWGVWVDLGLSCVGFIDALYIDDDDHYVVGDTVIGYLSSFDEKTGKFWVRPPGQKPVGERLLDPSYGAGVDQ
jgi:hypothetical protein